jgi:WD40 repeat protein
MEIVFPKHHFLVHLVCSFFIYCRCYLLDQEVDDSFESCALAIHDHIHCPHILTSIRDACEGMPVFGVYDVAHRLPIVRDLHSLTHQIWTEYGRSVPIVCHGVRIDLKRAMDKLHFKGHGDWIRAMATDDWTLYSASCDSTVRLWDLESMESKGVLEGHQGSVEAILLSPDGLLLFSASVDHTIRVWDTDSLAVVAVMEGHELDVRTLMWYTEGGRERGKGRGRGGEGKVMDEEKDEEKKEDSGESASLLLSGGMDGSIIFWRTDDYDLEDDIQLESDSIGILSLEHYHKDLFAGCSDCTIRHFNIETRQQLRVLHAHGAWVRCLCVYDHKLFSSCDGGELKVWGLDSDLTLVGEVTIAERSYELSVVGDALYLPCGARGAYKLNPTTLKKWSIPHDHHIHHGPLYCLTNSRKRGTLYCGFEDGSILEYLLTDY